MTVEEFLQSNIATNKEVQKACELTQRQVSFQINKLASRVVSIKNGRSPLYALTKPAFGVGDSINIWEVDHDGKHTCIAALRPLSAGGFFVQDVHNMPKVFLGEAGNGLYDDLPFFLTDMAPKGFLGKRIAELLSKNGHGFPAHLRDWKTEHIGRYLLANTDSSVGNLKFGNNANLDLRPSFSRHSREQYLSIADDIIGNEEVFSSAGGEQQKFTTYCVEANAHVLVKFSPKGDDANARRWKDILLTEHYASKTINSTNAVIAAETSVFEDGGRLFLESKRFDRFNEHGRRSMLSLMVIDAEFVGSGISWLDACDKLLEQKLISSQDAYNVYFLSKFARLIHNTDTHLGNISFATHRDGFSLLPIYDMCSMGFAPKSNGEVSELKFDWPPNETEENSDIKAYAKQFWYDLAGEPLLSEELRRFIFDMFTP